MNGFCPSATKGLVAEVMRMKHTNNRKLVTLAAMSVLACSLVGCSHTISKTETTRVHSDGTVSSKEKTIRENPDGTITKTETRKTGTP